MSVSYDPSLATNRDFVRFLIGDTNTASAELQDEEIDAVIAEETATGDALKYFAAARALSVLQLRWSSKGQGVMEKQVSKLRIEYGTETSAAAAIQGTIKSLRERGAWLLAPTGSRIFKAL